LLECGYGLEISQCRYGAFNPFQRDAVELHAAHPRGDHRGDVRVQRALAIAQPELVATQPITDIEVTRRPMMSESDCASRRLIVRGNERLRPMTASVATRCISRPRCAAKPRTASTPSAPDASLQRDVYL
jgi:hypothetical protein